MHDPQVIEELAGQPDSDDPVLPLDGYDPLTARLINIEDRLTQNIVAALHGDPATAPRAPRPELPFEARRREVKEGRFNNVALQLIPGGD